MARDGYTERMRRALVCLLVLCLPALAGGGPETTVLVVNGASPFSRRVALHYAKAREIPFHNVIYLRSVPHTGVISWDEFLDSIWKPVNKAIQDRGLTPTLLAYSADFPYAVDYSTRAPEAVKVKQFGRQASLTGATYLAKLALSGRDFWLPNTNTYFGVATSGQNSRRMNAEERELWSTAQTATQKRKYADAAKAYEKLIETFGHASVVHYNYACALALDGKKTAALDALDAAVERGFNRAQHAAGDSDLRGIRSNPRFRKALNAMRAAGNRSRIPVLPARAFSAEKDPYLPCVMLGYTGLLGNSWPEIRNYLDAAANSDSTDPDGTVYLCKNKNVRSTTREPFFAATVAQLKKLKRKVEILDNTVTPSGKDDVFGAVVGSASHPWAKTKSTLMPGSIAESLTSFGAHFGTTSQSKLTEFLRHGAAGSSGTVMEPYALAHKFPLPLVHAYYAEGLSLAEAMYYSVQGPYQLLIVGDGLAQPCAPHLTFAVDTLESWAGNVTLTSKGDDVSFELFVDGRRVATGSPVRLDSTELDDGWHDVRVVAVRNHAVATRESIPQAVMVRNGPAVTFKRDRKFFVAEGPVQSLALYESGERLDAKDGSKIPAPTRAGWYQLVATRKDGKKTRDKPFFVEETEEMIQPPLDEVESAWAPGLVGAVVGKDGKETPVGVVELNEATRNRARLAQYSWAKGAKKITLRGTIEIPANGWFQLAVRFAGELSLQVGDGGPSVVQKSGASEQYLAGAFEKGRHDIEIELTPKGAPQLQVLLGGDVVTSHAKFHHRIGEIVRPFEIKGDLAKVDPKDGITLVWKRTEKRVSSIALVPKGHAATEWVVEYASTSRGKFKPMKELTTTVTGNPARGKNASKAPSSIEWRFKPVTVRRIRLRPKTASALASVSVGRK